MTQSLPQSIILCGLFVLIGFSKEVFVFNEEVLVLFSFSFFIYTVYRYASNSIGSELDVRSNKIQEDFDYYKNIQEKTLINLISYHNKQKLLCAEVKAIFAITKKDASLLIPTYSRLFLKSLTLTLEDKLRKVIANESKFNSMLQDKINSELHVYLISKYKINKDKKSLNSLLTSSITSLSTIK